MDNLRPEWIKVLSEIGNDIANKYYLHNLPPHAVRPSQNTSAYDMEIWIRNKYERKLYAIHGLDEPYKLLANGYNPRAAVLKAIAGSSSSSHAQPAHQPGSASKKAPTQPMLDFGSGPAATDTVDLFAEHNAKSNAPFDAFGNSAPASSWTGDFWPSAHDTKPPSARAAGGAAIPQADFSAFFEQKRDNETQIEASKDAISKLFDNPEQIGFRDSSYKQTAPSCVQGDLLDFDFGDLSNKIQEQKKQYDDLI